MSAGITAAVSPELEVYFKHSVCLRVSEYLATLKVNWVIITLWKHSIAIKLSQSENVGWNGTKVNVNRTSDVVHSTRLKYLLLAIIQMKYFNTSQLSC